jgi:hypothetical protein
MTATLPVLLTSGAAAAPKKGIDERDWTYIVEMPVPPRRGKEQPPRPACLWLPKDVDKVRGLFYPGGVMIDKKLGTDREVREALAKEKMGVLFFHLGSNFIQGGGKYLDDALAELAKVSGHPEVEFAPLLTAGHSAAGLFCRNVAYWKPHRVIAVVMIKSGNFHHAIEDMSRSLRGVPLAHFSGEFEKYGPEGGDLGAGLRSQYATTGPDGQSKNQTQWVMTRMQMLDRRRKNEDNIWTLVVDRGGGHTSWSDDMTKLFIQYLHSVAAARIPTKGPDGKHEVQCLPLTAEDGWLYDADIKTPKHEPAPYEEYAGDKRLAFWAPDATMAKAIWKYHNQGPWEHPDPTAGESVEKRFYPPPLLQDVVDAPPPAVLKWKGGDGTWDTTGRFWLEEGKASAWNEQRHAVFDANSGTVSLADNQTCLGLTVGPGCTLNLGGHHLRVRWHAQLDARARVHVSLDTNSRRTDRSGVLNVEGNAILGGTLHIEVREDLKPGPYGICSVKGVRKGDFTKVVAPDGCTIDWHGSVLCLTVPPPPRNRDR